jgi:N-acylneuraminate cytidylyltransferase
VARALAIVPARGGSKRLPRKNLALVGGRPLVARTLEAAVGSGRFDRVVLSSDDEDILAAGRAVAGVTAELRPAALAQDTTKAIEVVCAYADRDDVGRDFDVIALLLPTCPFRRAASVREGFDLLTPEVDGVVSVTTFEFPPQLGVTLDPVTLAMRPFVEPSPLISGDTRSQDQAPAYRPNGGFYIAWLASLRRHRNFFRGAVRGYVMSRLESVDIDDAADLAYARWLADTGAAI